MLALVIVYLFDVKIVTRGAFCSVRHLAIGRGMSSVVATSRPVHVISVSASSVINSGPLSGIVQLGPASSRRRSNRIVNVIAVVASHCHIRCTLICADGVRRTMTSGRIRLIRQGTFRGPRVDVSARSVITCTVGM